MTTNAKTEAPEALYSMLSAFHSLGDQSLRCVWQVYTESCLEKLILDFGSVCLLVIAEEDDSINFKIADKADLPNVGAADVSSKEPWLHFIGKIFGWGWMTINQQGYSDGVLLSFEQVVFPEVVLNVIASSLRVGMVAKVP